MFVSFFSLPDSLCSVLWNLYHFYKQFLDPVQAKIVELRSPIEKELKVRWIAVIITSESTKSAHPLSLVLFCDSYNSEAKDKGRRL